MDYTHTSFFSNPPPYQFMGNAHVPPLTPAHSNSVASDDFNTTSPPEIYDQYPPNGLPHEQFPPNFDGYVQQYSSAQAFPGPPTPPGQHPAVHAAVAPPPPVNGLVGSTAAADVLALSKTEPEDAAAAALSGRQGSNSEEDDLTPAQSRRKAQNRAAQRAFRERKERHVKDLESRLSELEQAQQDAASENERLKRDLQKMSTENEILRATSSMATAASAASPPQAAPPTTTGPMTYKPTDFYSTVLSGHANKTPSHRIVTSERGERLLAAAAAWEYIVNHDLYKRGMVDMAQVSDMLKPQAKCDGQGPVFEESAIIEAIQRSMVEGSDELI